MTIIVDSGFVYGLYDKGDKNHARAVAFMRNLPNERLILPTIALVEISQLLAKKQSHYHMRAFIQGLKSSPMKLEPLLPSDISRIYSVLEKYKDNQLDFVDASIVTLAERLGVTKILTVDKRDFGVIRPLHCDYFEILP